ncbi:MAG: SUMF1/EgtB/PvdO family nonheme iron enzyme [Kiritimatiellae bacterium]|nr:SUMF1/EgtB/PvdO family nonheme iron enzyme [Kiritimatiellia bacterium]
MKSMDKSHQLRRRKAPPATFLRKMRAFGVDALACASFVFLTAADAPAVTIRSKSDMRLWETVSSRSIPLSWQWEEAADSAELVFSNRLTCVVSTVNCNRRTVTFTSDFYVGIFKYTEAQHTCLSTGTAGTGYTPQTLSYNVLRGEKSAESGDWPTTGYKVAAESVVAKLRAKAGAGLVVDLCEEEQWEVAARANTTTFWPTGGTVAESLSTHTNQVNAFIAWYGNGGSVSTVVGARHANGWGLYDVVGLAGEWTLDTAKNTGINTFPDFGLPDVATDPVGISGGTWRIIKSANGNGNRTALYDLLPCRRQMASPDSASYSTRFCIHLKPLVKEGGQP